jgi:hypothetical protein
MIFKHKNRSLNHLVSLLVVSTFLMFLVSLLLPLSNARAATCTVTTDADSGTGSLRDKIGDSTCDTINFDPTFFSSSRTITLTTELDITRNLTIDGTGVVTPTISGNNVTRVFSTTTDSDATLNRLDISNGNGYGAGIYNTGTLTVMNTRLSNNNAPLGAGGGIINIGTLQVMNSTLFQNSSIFAGGGIGNSGVLTVTNSAFTGNTTQGFGGGINNSGKATVANSTFLFNRAYEPSEPTVGGGAIYNEDSYVQSYGTFITVTNSIFSGNYAGIGGGIYNNRGKLMVANSSLLNNTANQGGGIYNDSFGTANNSFVAATVTNSVISGNSALSASGGIGNYYGTITVTNSTITGNSALSASGGSGGIGNFAGTITVTNSTITGNTSNSAGGGFQNSYGTAILTNVTLSGNRALGTSDDGGGGVMVYMGNVSLVNSTISGNQTTSTVATDGGGGITVKSGSTTTVTLANTLVVNNTSATNKPDLSGNYISGGYNLIGSIDGSTGITNGINSDIAGTNTAPIDAHIGTLGYYGGNTQTIPLLPGSPAIDWIPVVNGSCNNTGITRDQREVLRPYPLGGNCDIGAFEFNGIQVYLPLIRR